MYKLIRPILFKLNPEFVHDTFSVMGQVIGATPLRNFTKAMWYYEHPMLQTKVAGINFKNPIGLAAGFDKYAILTNFMHSIGFGFEEIGSISGAPNPGNPKPRLWRLPKDKSIVVNYGLNNKGAKATATYLKRKKLFPWGISVVKANDSSLSEEEGLHDIITAFKTMQSLASYITFNLSCPNTVGVPFYDPKVLSKLLNRISKCKITKPIFLKLKPDINRKMLDDTLRVISRYKFVTGLVISNLTTDRSKLKSINLPKEGNLSGLPLQKKSDEMIKYTYKKTKGKYVIIGVGGIFTAEDAYRKIRNGASLVQLITGLIYEGPGVIKKINKGLVQLLKRDGFKNISEAVGVDAR